MFVNKTYKSIFEVSYNKSPCPSMWTSVHLSSFHLSIHFSAFDLVLFKNCTWRRNRNCTRRPWPRNQFRPDSEIGHPPNQTSTTNPPTWRSPRVCRGSRSCQWSGKLLLFLDKYIWETVLLIFSLDNNKFILKDFKTNQDFLYWSN